MQEHTLQDRLIISILTTFVVFLILAVFDQSQAAVHMGKSEKKSGEISQLSTRDPLKNNCEEIMASTAHKQYVHQQTEETVILLHGLGRTSRSMQSLKEYLEHAGFRVININYPSRKLSIETIAEKYVAPKVQLVSDKSQKIHFVTHSMGGIVVRYYLANTSLDKIGGVVMLAPPNGGSELIDLFKRWKVPQKVLGPAAYQLSTDTSDLVHGLDTICVPTGVITGNWSWNPLFSLLVPGPDDGKVSVQSTKLPGIHEHLITKTSHTFIMQNKNIHVSIENFLKNNSFTKK